MKAPNLPTQQFMHYGNAQWLSSVSKPSRFTRPNIAFHRKMSTANESTAFSATATESTYVWNITDNNSKIHNSYGR